MSEEAENAHRSFGLKSCVHKPDVSTGSGILGTSGQYAQLGCNEPDFKYLATIPTTSSYQVQFEGYEVSVDPLDWRSSTLLQLQVVAAFCNFILFGLADQTLGTIIPLLENHYTIDDSRTGLIFLSSTGGYFLMALVTEVCHRNLGVRGIGIMGAFCMSLSNLIIFQKPPFIIFVFAYFLAGVGCGSLDAGLNGWMGNLVDSNQLLGILHGCYGIGCMITPPVLTYLLERTQSPWFWNDYYLVLSCLAALCMIYYAVVFRHETPTKYRFMMMLNEARNAQKSNKSLGISEENDACAPIPYTYTETSALSSTKTQGDLLEETVEDPFTETPSEPVSLSEALSSKLVWTFSLIMFIYVGAEASFGSWLITFLTRIKHLSYVESSYMATAFWTGLTLGRIFLGFVTAHYFENELNANWCYIALSFLGHAIFCLVIYTSFTKLLIPIVLFSGLFVGPIFPTNITSAISILPTKFHVSGVGFICAFGGGGAAAMPFLVGTFAEASEFGLRFFPFFIAVLYLVLLAAWTLVRVRNNPKVKLTS